MSYVNLLSFKLFHRCIESCCLTRRHCPLRLAVGNLKVFVIVKRVRYVLLLVFFPIPDARRFCLTGVDGKDIYGKLSFLSVNSLHFYVKNLGIAH